MKSKNFGVPINKITVGGILLRLIYSFSFIFLFGLAFASAKAALGAPPLKSWPELLSLYHPDRALNANDGLRGWADCADPDRDHQPVRSENGELLAKCQPDTLYSWGPDIKLFSILKKTSTRSEEWDQALITPIFAHINPVSTFGYGDYPIRIKLRRSTTFKYYVENAQAPVSKENYCKLLLNAETARNTVLVRYWMHSTTSGVDYILCSVGPIHSWSFGTGSHYDEIVKSYQWSQSHTATREWLPYIKVGGHAQLMAYNIDGFDFSDEHLRRELTNMRQIIDERVGNIYFAPGIEPERDAHFGTNRPSYWNTDKWGDDEDDDRDRDR